MYPHEPIRSDILYNSYSYNLRTGMGTDCGSPYRFEDSYIVGGGLLSGPTYCAMKELTFEEFQDRMGALERAGRIFPDVLNISDRFRIYQEVFAEREREIFLSTNVFGNRPRTIMDKYERPKCECGSDMFFRMVPPNDEGIKVQLICSNKEHTESGSVLDSDNDLSWWMSNLRIKDERN